jgi:hypothetical protein
MRWSKLRQKMSLRTFAFCARAPMQRRAGEACGSRRGHASVLRCDDTTRRCVHVGAKTIVRSNREGLSLESNVPAAEALPEIVKAASRHAEVYLDDGIGRGIDIRGSAAGTMRYGTSETF